MTITWQHRVYIVTTEAELKSFLIWAKVSPWAA
jgi:hypothetical protein